MEFKNLSKLAKLLSESTRYWCIGFSSSFTMHQFCLQTEPFSFLSHTIESILNICSITISDQQLDSVERDGDSIRSFENSHEQEVPEPESKPESASVRNVRNVRKSRTEEAALNEMAKDLRRVKRQNFITHCLLSVIVVGIAVWQFNEVSFLLAVKEKFSNPLRAVGDAIKGSIKWRKKKKKQKLQIEGGVPELARGDLPKLVLNDEG